MRTFIHLLAALCLSLNAFAEEPGAQTLDRVADANIFKRPVKIICKETTREPMEVSEFLTLGNGKHLYGLTKTGPTRLKIVADGEHVWHESVLLLDKNTYVDKATLAEAESKWPNMTVRNPFMVYIRTLREVMVFKPAVSRTENGERVLEIAGKLDNPAELSLQNIAREQQQNPVRAKMLQSLLDIEGLHGCAIIVGEHDLIPRRITYVDVRGQLTMQYLFTVQKDPQIPAGIFKYTPPADAMMVEHVPLEPEKDAAGTAKAARGNKENSVREWEAKAIAEREKEAKAKAEDARARAEKERKRREELEMNGVR